MVKPNKRQYAIPARRWPWITAIALGCLAVVAVMVVVFTDVGPEKKPSTGGTIETESPAQRADGCLGGSDPETAVIEAQDAPHTPAGAAAFTATYLRWAIETNGTSDDVAAQVLTATALQAPKEQTFRGSTFDDPMRAQPENYEVLDVQENRVKVESDLTFWNDTTGESSSTLAVLDVVLVDGEWHLERADEDLIRKWAEAGPSGVRAEKDRLKAEGTPYDGSC